MNNTAKFLCIVLALALAACSSGSMEKVESGHSTSFDGEVLRIEFEREDGGKERFSALRDRWYAWSWVPFLPNHSGRRWVMGKTNREGTSIAYTLVSWDNDEPTDYLAAGYWMRFDGFRRDYDLPIAAADLVMFIDGTEIDPAFRPNSRSRGQRATPARLAESTPTATAAAGPGTTAQRWGRSSTVR